MKLLAALAVTAAGFVATVTAPAGPTLSVAVATLAAGAVCVANVIADRLIR